MTLLLLKRDFHLQKKIICAICKPQMRVVHLPLKVDIRALKKYSQSLVKSLCNSDGKNLNNLSSEFIKSKTMKFEKLVPNIFYDNITDGLKLFVDCLDFSIGHNELKSKQPFVVLEKDGLRINLFENTELAREHYPEFRLVTKNIEEVYKKVSLFHPEFLHPNLKKITLRPWGAKEFAVRDNQLGVIIQQW